MFSKQRRVDGADKRWLELKDPARRREFAEHKAALAVGETDRQNNIHGHWSQHFKHLLPVTTARFSI